MNINPISIAPQKSYTGFKGIMTNMEVVKRFSKGESITVWQYPYHPFSDEPEHKIDAIRNNIHSKYNYFGHVVVKDRLGFTQNEYTSYLTDKEALPDNTRQLVADFHHKNSAYTVYL